tara:strand:- start:5653 stop:6165 length:513 start_codon:yes stop_codon:yes gene_type:complete
MKSKKTIQPIITSILILLFINGCSTLSQISQTKKAIESCEFTLRKITPSIDIGKPKITLKGIKGSSVKIEFNLHIDVFNTTDIDLTINKMNLSLFADNKLIVSGTTNKHTFIKSGETSKIKTKLSVDPKNATKKLSKKLKKKEIAYRVEGKFYFKYKKWDIPVTVSLAEK